MSNPMSPSKQRTLLVLGTLIFIGCYQWAYINWLYPAFGYFGYDYNPSPPGYVLLAWVLSALPSLWMPLSLGRPSQLIYWVLYLTVFIPSMFIPLFAALNRPPEVAELMLTLFVGFAIVGMGYGRSLMRLNPPHISWRLFWYGFALVGGVFTVWVIAAFRGNLFFVSFLDIYDVRSGADVVMEGTLLNYPLMLLSGAINPFLMGWGLYQKKKWFFVAGALGQLLVYSTLATKGSIISLLFIPAIYLLLRRDHSRFALRLIAAVVALFAASSLASVLAGENTGPFVSTILFVVFSRTFGANGLLSAQYYDFFQINPHTYLSHAKGFSWFAHYPYANPLGIEVGSHYTGDSTFDASAHFWATDGLAGFGLPGILLASALCALVFWMLDSIAQKHDTRFAALVISYAAYNFANASLFTTLLSGGLGLLMLLLYLMPRGNSEVSLRPMNSASVVATQLRITG